jgi:signal transduction histidine kinase
MVITLRASEEPDGRRWVEMRFSDQGWGIEEKEMEKIFDPFFTTKEQGTGLGLAIVNRIVAGYGGGIQVDSKVGEGTVFTVKIPLA